MKNNNISALNEVKSDLDKLQSEVGTRLASIEEESRKADEKIRQQEEEERLRKRETLEGVGIIVYKWHSQGISLSGINPNTGTILNVRNFQINQANVLNIENIFSPIKKRQEFDANYRRVTAQRTETDGSVHVGWLTEDGAFFDITEVIFGPEGDFSTKITNKAGKFGPNNYFYFLNFNYKTVENRVYTALIRVPISNPSKSNFEVIDDDFGGSNDYYIQPDGSVLKDNEKKTYSDSSMRYSDPGNNYWIEDWIDQTKFIGHRYVSDFGANDFFICDASLDPYDSGYAKRLLPAKYRNNYTAVVSPNGKQVAFLSEPREGSETAGLFTVSTSGGSPVKVQTDYSFSRLDDGFNNLIALLDWR